MLYPLYIDPGTGSMLFSILIGAAATLYFLFRALFIKIKVAISGGKAINSSAASCVIYNEGKQYFNVFKPVLDIFEKEQQELIYLTSAEDDPVFQEDYQYIKKEYIGEGNRAFARLNFLSADVVLMTTPGLDVYQLKRSKNVKHYSHILHAPSDATMYRLFGIDYFDSILLTGDYQAKDIRELEKIRNLPEKELVTVGCTYLDVYNAMISRIPQEENHQFTVLVSPSWGPSGILARYGKKLLEPLLKTDWRIIVRPHPQSKKSESLMLDDLASYFGNMPNLVWDYDRENIFSLARADIMISDFSGIIYDYIFLFNKPVVYIKQNIDLRPYDADDLDHEIWQFSVLRDIAVELKEEEIENINDIIKKYSGASFLKAVIQKAKETAWQHQGESGKRVFDYMIKIKHNFDMLPVNEKTLSPRL
ncbi:MAG: CDP-glycerol glycerophosphotransferase family protein [Treponema sp.]|nr:CDP-glycerol glycerophosphotransferase family protein [Treponema sp.]